MEKRNNMLPINTFVIVGPESTGKTTLCKALAKHYNTIWIPEYARTYLEQKSKPYDYDDVIHIAQKQITLETEILLDINSYLFIDTDLIVTKIWLLHVYKYCPAWIDEYLKTAYRKAYLITYFDLPWENDPLRENPHLRKYLFNQYINEIESLKIPYHIVKGLKNNRVQNAIEYIDSLKML